MPQQSYPTAMPFPQAGTPYGMTPHRAITLINDSPRTAQVDTYTVDTGTNSHSYSITINGVTITYVADSSTSTTEVAAGLAAAVNAKPLVSGAVLASAAAAVLTLTSRIAGLAFLTTAVDALGTLVLTTADDDADPVPFGALVFRDGTSSKLGKLAAAAALSVQVVVLTPTAVNAGQYSVTITIGGIPYTGLYTADGSATAQEIVEGLTAALNTALPASTVLVSEDNALLTLTGEVAGLSYTVDPGYGLVQTSDTGVTALTDISLAAAGVTIRTEAGELVNGVAQYPANSAMGVMTDGDILVDTQDASDPTLPVFVGVASTALGKWRASAAANYVRLDPKRFYWTRTLSTTKAVLAVRL